MIVPDKEQKYILIKSGGDYFIEADLTVAWHKEIAEKVLEKYPKEFEVQGGGWIKVNSTEKRVDVWGESTKYGLVDVDSASLILSKSYPGFEIKFKLG